MGHVIHIWDKIDWLNSSGSVFFGTNPRKCVSENGTEHDVYHANFFILIRLLVCPLSVCFGCKYVCLLKVCHDHMKGASFNN